MILIEMMQRHAFFYWLGALFSVLWIANWLMQKFLKKSLSDLPGKVKVILAAIASALISPLLLEFAYSAFRGEVPTPNADQHWGMRQWPIEGVAAFAGAFAAVFAYTFYSLWEPLKEELLVRLPSWLIYSITWAEVAIITGLCSALVAFMIMARTEVQFLTIRYHAVLAGACVGPAVTISLWLRTKKCRRFVTELFLFPATGTLTYWFVLREQTVAVGIALGSFCICWLLIGAIRGRTALIRTRQLSDYRDGRSPTPRPKPDTHRCPTCDREFITFRGLRIHQGRIHKSENGDGAFDDGRT